MPPGLPVVEKIPQINAAFLTSRPIYAIIHPLKKDTLTANPSSPDTALPMVNPARGPQAAGRHPGMEGPVAPGRPRAGTVIWAAGCGVMSPNRRLAQEERISVAA
jgi:hypothetical protein